jgi:hypothetical protein
MLEKNKWSNRRPGTLAELFAALPACAMAVAIIPLLLRSFSESPGDLWSGEILGQFAAALPAKIVN